MLIENITPKNYVSRTAFAKRKENSVPSNSAFGPDDRYIPSFPSKEVKAKDLSEIKERIKSGFYNSSAVDDDLTEVFSEIFKKAF